MEIIAEAKVKANREASSIVAVGWSKGTAYDMRVEGRNANAGGKRSHSGGREEKVAGRLTTCRGSCKQDNERTCLCVKSRASEQAGEVCRSVGQAEQEKRAE